jgi:hypothetical protein
MAPMGWQDFHWVSGVVVVTQPSRGATGSGQAELDITHNFSTLPARNLSPNSKGTGLRQASTLLLSGYSHDPLMPAPSIPNVVWDSVSLGITSSVSSNDSPPTRRSRTRRRRLTRRWRTDHSNLEFHRCYITRKSLLAVWSFRQGATTAVQVPSSAICLCDAKS